MNMNNNYENQCGSQEKRSSSICYSLDFSCIFLSNKILSNLGCSPHRRSLFKYFLLFPIPDVVPAIFSLSAILYEKFGEESEKIVPDTSHYCQYLLKN